MGFCFILFVFIFGGEWLSASFPCVSTLQSFARVHCNVSLWVTGYQSNVLRLAFASTAATTHGSRAWKPNHSDRTTCLFLKKSQCQCAKWNGFRCAILPLSAALASCVELLHGRCLGRGRCRKFGTSNKFPNYCLCIRIFSHAPARYTSPFSRHCPRVNCPRLYSF